MKTLIVELKNGDVLKIPDGSILYCNNCEWAIFDYDGVLIRKVPNEDIKDRGVGYVEQYY